MIKKELEELKEAEKKGLLFLYNHINDTVLKDNKVEVPVAFESTKKKITILKFIKQTHPDKH